MTILIDGSPNSVKPGERLVEVIGRAGVAIPHVCYHPQLGPIQTCDTCLVEVEGELVRACATPVSHDMSVRTPILLVLMKRLPKPGRSEGGQWTAC
jgi:formate dehydrogenase major subunit